jgi:hypothetical protein
VLPLYFFCFFAVAFACHSSPNEEPALAGCPILRALCEGWDVKRLPAAKLLLLPLYFFCFFSVAFACHSSQTKNPAFQFEYSPFAHAFSLLP